MIVIGGSIKPAIPLKLEWIKVEKIWPYHEPIPPWPKMSDGHNITLSIANPADVPRDVTVSMNEKGALVEYDDLPCKLDPITKIMPAREMSHSASNAIITGDGLNQWKLQEH